MELHHVQWKSKGGLDDIENAIPLCFECHAEVNHYNPEHPKGRKFSEEELLEHKRLWVTVCEKHPEALVAAPRDTDIGPLEGMLLELEYNASIVDDICDGTPWQEKIGRVLNNGEYQRSVSQGSLLLLPNVLRKIVNKAYAEVGRINTFISMYSNTRPEGNAFAEATNRLLEAYRKSQSAITDASSKLNEFLLQERRVE